MNKFIMTLAVALWGCGSDNVNGTGDTVNDDGGSTTAFSGMATVIPQLEGATWSVTVTGSDISYTGMTGDSIDVETDDNGETFVVDFGNEIGCDGQSINGDQMALSQTVDLADGDTLNVNATPFEYYEWNGALQCTAWDDWGWEFEYDVQSYTNDGKQNTCVNDKGDLKIGGDKLHFSSGEAVMNDDVTVTLLEVTVNGLSLTSDLDGDIVYFDCIVVD